MEKSPPNKLKNAEIKDFGSFLFLQTGQVGPEPAREAGVAIKF
jgi:hypothetical protein